MIRSRWSGDERAPLLRLWKVKKKVSRRRYQTPTHLNGFGGLGAFLVPRGKSNHCIQVRIPTGALWPTTPTSFHQPRLKFCLAHTRCAHGKNALTSISKPTPTSPPQTPTDTFIHPLPPFSPVTSLTHVSLASTSHPRPLLYIYIYYTTIPLFFPRC